MADTIKCPSCSANLIFDADSGKLTCSYCGTSFFPDEIKSEVDELGNEISPVEAASSGSIFPEAEAPAAAGDGQEHCDDYSEFVCNSCGAAIVTDSNTSASFCAFCGSPAIIGGRLKSEFRPRYIIPFSISRERAIQQFLSWCKGGRMTPFGFASDKNIEKMKGLYVPFWLFDVEASMDIESLGKKISVRHIGNTTETTTSTYKLLRRAEYAWKNIPIDAETRIRDDLMEAIEPFEYHELRDYDYKYIPGFYADRYDLPAEQLVPRANARASGYMLSQYYESVSEYDSNTITSDKSMITNVAANYSLLPVWFLNYKYHGKSYEFVMNGQTGEVAGVPPVSSVKRIVLFAVLLGILAIAVRIIVNLMLGDFGG